MSLYPSPSFLSKNQLAREGPSCVVPVVIPAWISLLRKTNHSARQKLYFTIWTEPRILGCQKDIVPATISSWIKPTVLLCYQLSDGEAQNLHQVRAHDVRAFVASKAFQGGVSLDQILSACHWKAHNTFIHFYLKDLAWANSEMYHLGPVVAAQQIHEDK